MAEQELRFYERILNSGGVLTPRDEFAYARALAQGGHSAAAARLQAFLDSGLGWGEHRAQARALLAHCAARRQGE